MTARILFTSFVLFSFIFSGMAEECLAESGELSRTDVSAELEQVKSNIISLIQNNNFAEARAQTRNLIADFNAHPDLAWELYWIAREFEWRLELEDANNIYQQIIQNHPDSSYASRAKLGIARVEVMSLILYYNCDLAKEALDKLVADFAGHPDLPETIYWLAERHRWAREYEQAKNLYQQIIQDHPDSTWANRAKLGFSRAQALSLINSGNSNQLEEAVDKLIVDFNDHPDLPETLYWIAQECEWMIKLKDANSIYQRVIDCCPETPWADKARLGVSRVNVGDVIEQGDLTAAEPAVDELIVDFNNHPDMPWALYWIAKRYEGQNEFEKAKQLYNQIIEQYPDSEYPELIEIDIPALDIRSLVRSGQHTEALTALDKLIADFNDNPYLPRALFMMGEDYYKQAFQYESQQAEAKELFLTAVAIWERIITNLPLSSIT